MRVLDLLQLLHDYSKNTLVSVQAAGAVHNIDAFEPIVIDEQPALVIRLKDSGKPLKCWELTLLLDKPTWRQRFLYAGNADEVRPLFGFQDRAQKGLVLN